ncbi:MAG: type III polyketide synthase [Candidatus Nephthysia bennettiae]|uniref:Type III polyketide synthase n=1 Tax=Candidatus Nephthysia bennettiae TaxID=3127016 RepID=A0A934K7J2_9BACT|nr:type III polyketide synthase [Candidatus Dormibacteraeota bacterium]MBJ7611588.1 type III polyketide synthase [Candidatus Dormibacteraeota bacterium]PZR99374.1 MAG: type III polyketide synthase [Candidatus Dormibacteraeota bacterium]
MSAFLGFGTALPEHVVEPAAAVASLRRVWPRLPAASPSDAVTRHTVEPLEGVLSRRTLSQAMRAYADHAPRLAEQASRRALAAAGVEPSEIDMVISVSCTGYMVPSLDVQLAREMGMRADIIRLPITELGCSGGSAAIAAAHRHLTAYPRAHVLVVAVEVCSLSFRSDDRSLDNLTAALVFGDGAAATVMSGDRADGLHLVNAASRLVPNSSSVLGFDLRDSGFHIVLDRRVPRLVEASLAGAVADFRARHRIDSLDFYAVHAGGPRIFDAVQSALRLGDDALAVSRRVFREVGNLSSASILFSLAALPETPGHGLAMAFGPGVTIELAHLHRGPRD